MPQRNKALFVRPSEDDGLGANRYGFYWLQPLIAESLRRRISVMDLHSFYATSEHFSLGLSEHDPLFVFGFGHGDGDTYTGQNYDVILEACQNDQVLRGRVVYLLSCHTATVLGQSMVQKGALSYIGYQENFVFATQDPPPANPLSDGFARAFFEPALEVAYALVRGQTTGVAYRRSQVSFNNWVEFWARQPGPEAPFLIEALLWDKNNQVLIGSSAETIATPTQASQGNLVIPIATIIAAGALLAL